MGGGFNTSAAWNGTGTVGSFVSKQRLNKKTLHSRKCSCTIAFAAICMTDRYIRWLAESDSNKLNLLQV